MMKRPRVSIRIKFIGITFIAVALTVAFTFFYYPTQQKKQINDAMVERLNSTAELIALSTGVALGLNSYDAIKESFEWLEQDTSIVYVLLYGDDGELFASYDHSPTPLDTAAILSHYSIYESDQILHGSIPIEFQGNNYGLLYIGYSLTPLHHRIEASQNLSLLIGLSILILGSVLAYFGGTYIAQPIKELQVAAKKMAEGDHNIRIRRKTNDEVGDLARAFNIMAENIDMALTELRESEQKFRNVTESAGDAIIGMDEKACISFWNPAAKRIFGYESQEVVGKVLHDIIVPEKYRDTAKLAVENFFKTGTGDAIGKSMQLSGIRKDGMEFPLELTLSAAKIHNKWLATGVIRDITDRVRHEEMREVLYNVTNAYTRSASLEELFANIHAILGKIMNVSNFFIATYDAKSQLLSFPYFVDERDEKPDPKPLGHGLTEYILRTKKPIFINQDEIRSLERQGEIDLIGTPSVQFLGVPLLLEHEPIGPITVQSYSDDNRYDIDDLAVLEYVSHQIAYAITKRRDADALQRSEEKYRVLSNKLEQSNQMKDLLLDIITHDLKNPAGVIYGISEMLLKEYPDDEMIKMVRGSSENLLKVITNATTLSKVSMDEAIRKQELDLYPIVNDIITGFATALKQYGIKVENNIDPNQKILANPIIEEVFNNYISNAIKYSAHGKKIVIDAKTENDNLLIYIRDFGTTIPEENREAVFMRNLQLGKTEGRGLGLAIVKRIAQSHGGKVWVEPNKPTGNTFVLQLPTA